MYEDEIEMHNQRNRDFNALENLIADLQVKVDELSQQLVQGEQRDSYE